MMQDPRRAARVLIVDDQPVNRQIYSQVVASVGADLRIHTFDAAEAALDFLAANRADLLITDYKMPGMDGAEFTRRVRTLPNGVDIPIIVITVYDDTRFRFGALEAGATDFLKSPVSHREFGSRVRNLLQLREQQSLIRNRAQVLENDLRQSELSREALVRDSRENLLQVIDTVPAMISATDRAGRCVFVNAYKAESAGIDPRVLGQTEIDFFGPEHARHCRELDAEVFATGRPITGYEEEIVDRQGSTRVLLTTKSPIRDHDGAVTSVLTTSLDITEQMRARSKMRFLALHDPLTGLPNRVLFFERVQQALTKSVSGGAPVAVLLLDLDRFKAINDSLGHPLGDQLLVAVAKRLLGCVRPDDVVARLGGDEFAILQADVKTPEHSARLAGRLIERISYPFSLAGQDVSTSVSIGIATSTDDGDTEEALLRSADLAMYKAKTEGRNRFRFYEHSLHDSLTSARATEAGIRTALALDQFVLAYQPQLDLRTRRIVAVEALLRWRLTDGTIRNASDFLPLAEEIGLISRIGEWVLRDACRQAHAWRTSGLEPLRLAVNVSPVQLNRQDFGAIVRGALEWSGLDPSSLEIELTERGAVDQLDRVSATLLGLRDAGVRIALDDFGTGYSSLSHLKRLPIDRLKIDASFIRNLEPGNEDAAIVRGIIGLAHGLELKVTAEGVETAEQLLQLADEGCDEVQGFFVGPPLPPDGLLELLERSRSVESVSLA
ncbi:MAG TPA: EAL domain-containing protein [Acetobacteraceae bacterium]|jgi:diguanylate cyclase (GGDEF)-like protein/PAS domain S-box-containing protein|nr:EAL domain-containing protein [Acetobacteraceae bacterium]